MMMIDQLKTDVKCFRSSFQKWIRTQMGQCCHYSFIIFNSNIINITICVSTSDSEDQSTPQDGVSRPVHCDLHEGPGPSHHPHQGLLVILLFASRCKLYLPRCYQTNIQSDKRKYNFLLQFIAAQQDHDLLGILMVLTNLLLSPLLQYLLKFLSKGR